VQQQSDRLDFAPPREPAAAQAFMFAIVAHLLLVLALTWGVNWNREKENESVEAELWSSVPQQAAPNVVQAPPVPPPAPPPAPPPPPPPQAAAPPPPPIPAPKPPDIALELEKKKLELAERRRQEVEQQKKLEARKKAEEQERDRKQLAERKKQEDARKEKLAEQKAAEDKKRKAEELAKAARAKQDEARLAALRKENLDRMMKGAAGSGSPTSAGTAERASGPSASYAGRIRASVRPNIVFTDDIAGNPTAEVEVRMAPDGTITSRRVVKSSGARSWDEAVLRALDRTEILPRDVDGRIHTPLIIEFRPRS
jgi:colicin import membrane protein